VPRRYHNHLKKCFFTLHAHMFLDNMTSAVWRVSTNQSFAQETFLHGISAREATARKCSSVSSTKWKICKGSNCLSRKCLSVSQTHRCSPYLMKLVVVWQCACAQCGPAGLAWRGTCACNRWCCAWGHRAYRWTQCPGQTARYAPPCCHTWNTHSTMHK
jgi:hypothetical protein